MEYNLPPKFQPPVDFNLLCWVLFWLSVLDFLTGIYASYIDWKKITPKGKLFFGVNQGFDSHKFRKSFHKALEYGGLIYLTLNIQNALALKTISIPSLTDREIEIASVLVIVFSSIELWSIVWENLPRIGVNLPDRFIKAINQFRNLERETT
jgi:phage-related holin